MLSSNEKKTLDKYFYGKDLMTRGFDAFKEAVKPLKIPKEKLQYYYNNQEVVQLFKPLPRRKDIKYIPIVSSAPFQVLYFDTMFITGLNLTLVNAIDLFSKYGFVMSFRGSVISSERTVKALHKFLLSIIQLGFYPSTIKCDSGSEFKHSFTSECKNLLINLTYTDPNDKLKTSPIESFNRTIRLSVEKLKTSLSNNNPITSQVEKGIKDIVYAYNNIPHSSIGYSPTQILESKEVQSDLELKYSLKKQEAIDQVKSVSIGSFVRVAIGNKRTNPFQKLNPSWSKELYKVMGYDKPRNRYTLQSKSGYYSYWDLQVVDKDNLMTHKTDRYLTDNSESDVIRKTYSQKKAEKETKDYLGKGRYYEGELGEKRVRKERVIIDL